jgi:Predicted hydrolase (HAD superfamily)
MTRLYTSLYRATAQTTTADIEPDAPLLAELGEIAGELYDPTAVEFRDGAREVIRYVTARYSTCLITNGQTQIQQQKLDSLGLTDTFDTTIICDPAEGIDLKPSQDPFERAVSRLSTDAHAIVHIGNTHGEDIQGAHTAGWQSVWVPVDRPHETLPTDPRPPPTYRLSSLTTLTEVL